MVKQKFSLGFIGSLFLKGGEYAMGIGFFDRAFKELKRGQDKLEADYFLGLFHIKARKEKVGLHHWRNIQDIKDTGDLQPDILNQIHLSLFLHFLDNYFISEAQEALNRIKPNGEIDLDIASLYLHLQKGYLEAKANNYDAACREWEHALSMFPSNWMLNQNLALAKVLLGKEEEAASHFNVLINELEKGGEQVFGHVYNFLFEESRKIFNHLVSFRTGAIQQIEAKRDIIKDNILSANKAYWSLNLRKGDGFKEAEQHYFRLVKIYNPERYPDEFKEIESAYAFFKKEGHLRKNEQLVFNSFDLLRFIEMGSKFVKSEIPEFPSVRKFINDFTRPARFFDLGQEVRKAREAVSGLKPEIPGPEYTLNDWLMDW
jgi:tetratricopeptide (TPR) repeat protein